MFRALTNWICAAFGAPSRSRRVMVRVGVSYRSDPDQVRALLERAARGCNLLSKEPAPVIGFDDFGASALEFSVNALSLGSTTAAAAASELRTEILRAFRAAGVEMPYAQHDVHLRDLDVVKAIIARIAEERAAKAAEGADGKPRSGAGVAGTSRRETG